jgi:hypothetical protein
MTSTFVSMKLRHSKGIDFPACEEAAKAAQEGIEDERLLMESISLNLTEITALRRAIVASKGTKGLDMIGRLLRGDEITAFVNMLTSEKKNVPSTQAKRKVDTIVEKMKTSRNRQLPVYVDI